LLRKLLRYYHTLKYLKWIQIKYRLVYLLKNKVNSKVFIPEYTGKSTQIPFSYLVPMYHTWLGNNSFEFLNIKVDFKDKIDWNYKANGKLWTYNLNYFEWLFQPGMSKNDGLKTINIYIQSRSSLKDGLEPFPTSLRLINWIKFVLHYDVQDNHINNAIHQDAYELLSRIEYHLLGNHLLENGFALFFAGNYLNDRALYEKGKEILYQQLEEQILSDGTHFELSPMYHLHMLFRILDVIQLSDDISTIGHGDNGYFREKAAMMVSWIENMKSSSGQLPHFNDSADEVAPGAEHLLDYAKWLNIKQLDLGLSDSGYRKFTVDNSELFFDVGRIGPDYIPGHAHADTFSFVLFLDGKPIIVDTGTSTYDIGDRRDIERATSSHNTVEVNGTNSSDVWGGFRVARRLNVMLHRDEQECVSASHDGYRQFGIELNRSFKKVQKGFEINDSVQGNSTGHQFTAYIHLHPEVRIAQISANKMMLNDRIQLSVSPEVSLTLESYLFCEKWNSLEPATRVRVNFKEQLETIINLSV